LIKKNILPTKEELLNKLDFEKLKDIADSEGIKYPKDVTRRFLVKLLGGVLTIETIKKYLAEYEEEEVEREITVKERLRRRTARVSREEVTKIVLSREKMILDLTKAKVSKTVLGQIANYYRSRFEPKKSMLEMLELLNDDALTAAWKAFCKKETDQSGRFFEWRMGEYLHDRMDAEIVKFREKIVGKDGVPYEIDVTGYDKRGALIIICECKSRGGSPSKEDITKWLAATKQIAKAPIGRSLSKSCFASTSPYTQDIIKLVKGECGTDGTLKLFAAKELLLNLERRKIVVILFEEREGGPPKQIYP